MAAGHRRQQLPAGLTAGLLDPELGYALRASAGPARTQARPAAPAGGPQTGQPGAIGQQFGDAAGARNGDYRPDTAAGQRQPLPRSVCRGVVRHATHDHYFIFLYEALERLLFQRPGDPGPKAYQGQLPFAGVGLTGSVISPAARPPEENPMNAPLVPVGASGGALGARPPMTQTFHGGDPDT